MLAICSEHRDIFTHPSRNGNKRGVGYVEADGPACPDVGNVEGEEFSERYIPPGDQRREDYRLATFCYSPLCLSFCEKICKLAASGFFYTGKDLNVACFSCGNAIKDWTKADASKQSGHKSGCEMAKGGGDSGNVSFESLWKKTFLKFACPCENQEFTEFLQEPSENQSGIEQMSRNTTRDWNCNRDDVGYVEADGPACPDVGNLEREELPERYVPPGDYRREDYRLATFSNSPLFGILFCEKVWKFAASGYYYTGKDEIVACFSCGNEVQNWTMEDDPFNLCCHKSDCKMAKNDGSENVALESLWREAVLKCTNGCGNQEFSENTQDPPESVADRDEMAGCSTQDQAAIPDLNADVEATVSPSNAGVESINSHDGSLSATSEEGTSTRQDTASLPGGARCRSRKRSETDPKETPPAKKSPDEPSH